MAEEAKTSDILDSQVEEFRRVTTWLTWRQRQHMGRLLRVPGLTMPRFLVLAFIHSHGDRCSMSELAAATDQCSATMTGIVNGLVSAGWVERQRDPDDRRSVLVNLTDAGQALVEQAKAELAARAKHTLSRFTEEERVDILRLLRRYVEILESEDGGGHA